MLAVIQTGGKQYIVHEGEELHVETLPNAAGDVLTFEALLVAGSEGKEVKIGDPSVKGAKVAAKVIEHGKEEKVHVIKFKSKSRYRRNVGHRQPFTKIRIEKITA